MTKCTEIGEYIGTITYEYRYDEDGNRTNYIKRVDGIGEVSYSYQYNSSNQLISRTNEHLWTDNVTYYTYDADGNLISEKTGLWETTYEYTAENRLSVVRQQGVVLMAALYDGDNNRLFTMDYTGICTAPDKSEGCGKEDCPFHNEEYLSSCFAEELEATEGSGEVILPDSGVTEPEEEACAAGEAMNRLASLVSERTQKLYTTTEYVNDITRSNEQVIAELNSAGDITDAYIYGNNRIADDVGDGMLYFLYDRTGSVTRIATEWGRVQESYTYDPYGNLTYGIPDSVNYYGYNGESTNLWTGLQDLRARYYDMSNGNFLSEDTYAGQVASPLTLNRYTYVCNNPINYIDPSGHFAFPSSITDVFSAAGKWLVDAGKTAWDNYMFMHQVNQESMMKEAYDRNQLIGEVVQGVVEQTEKFGETVNSIVDEGKKIASDVCTKIAEGAVNATEKILDLVYQTEMLKAEQYMQTSQAICNWLTDEENAPFVNLAITAGILVVAGVITAATGGAVLPIFVKMLASGLLSGGAHAVISHLAGEDAFEGFTEGMLGGVAVGALSPGVDKAIGAASKYIPVLSTTMGSIVAEGFGETVIEEGVVSIQGGDVNFATFMADWLVNSFTNGKNPTMKTINEWLDNLCKGAKAKLDEWFGGTGNIRGGTGTVVEEGLEALSTPSSKVLRQNLIDAGVEVPDYPNAAHHIVAGNSAKAEEARAILQKFGIDINDAVNGVFLPTVKDTVDSAYHPSLHTDQYYRTVTEMLSQAQSKDDVIDILSDIAEQLKNGTFEY